MHLKRYGNGRLGVCRLGRLHVEGANFECNSPLSSKRKLLQSKELAMPTLGCLLYIGVASDNCHVSQGIAFPYLCPVNLLTGDFLNPLPFRSLTFYSLSDNNIGNEGTCALAGALHEIRSLLELE